MLLWLIFRLYLPWVILSTNKKNSSLFVVPSRGLMMVSQPMTGWRTEIGYRGTIRLDAFMTFACTLPCPMSRDENGVVSKSEPPFHHSIIPSFHHSIIPSNGLSSCSPSKYVQVALFPPLKYAKSCHKLRPRASPLGPTSPVSQDTVIARDSSDEEEERGCKLPEAPGAASGAQHDPSGTVAHTLKNYKLYIIYKQILNTFIVYIYTYIYTWVILHSRVH